MSGRARLSSDVSEIKLAFSIPPHRPTSNFPPSWNVAPTDQLPVVRYDTKAGERSLDLLRWGLVPYWAKDIKVGFANINAKAEGIETRPAFREAFQRRRCLVPVDNFYEWVKDRNRQAALCDRAGRPGFDGAGRPVGELAFAGGRMGAQLRDHHNGAKRAVRAAS
jgi:putative SOS response-associated peptidase YedK